jgi:PKD repeat protein
MFSVTLAIDGPGGVDSITYPDLITVSEPVVADFSGSPTEGPKPHKVDFTNLSSGDYDTCLWEFGDGSSSSDCLDPGYTYLTGGIFTVTLTVSGPGGSDSKSISDYITVGQPTATFSATPLSGVAPLTVNFSNLSTGEVSSCTWTFGDGDSSNECNDPSHTYLTAGVYSVSLAVDGPAGADSGTLTDLITVYEPVVADFSASPTEGPKPLLVNFTNLSSGDYDTCLWEFGDGETSSDCAAPSHTYTASGSYTVSLLVSGPGGSNSLSKAAYIIVDPYQIYVPTLFMN